MTVHGSMVLAVLVSVSVLLALLAFLLWRSGRARWQWVSVLALAAVAAAGLLFYLTHNKVKTGRVAQTDND